MKLQRQPGKTYVNKDGKRVKYDRFAVVIPTDLVEELGWEAGLQLVATRRGKALTLRPEGARDE